MKIMAEYRREMNRNYLVIKRETEKGDRYTEKMLLENKISGLLPFHEKRVDGQIWFYYDITSRQPLERLLGYRNLKGEEIVRLISDILFTLKHMERFLLDESHLCLEPGYIYVEPDSFQCSLCLIPGRWADFSDEFRELTKYLLDHISHTDTQAVVLAFGIFQESGKENFGMDSIERILYDSGKLPKDRKELEKEKEGIPETTCIEESSFQEPDLWRRKNKGGRKEERIEKTENPSRKNEGSWKQRNRHWAAAVIFPTVILSAIIASGIVLGWISVKWMLIPIILCIGAGIWIAGKRLEEEKTRKTENTGEKENEEKAEDWEIQLWEQEDEPSENENGWDFAEHPQPKRETGKEELSKEGSAKLNLKPNMTDFFEYRDDNSPEEIEKRDEEEIQTVLLNDSRTDTGQRMLVPTKGGEEIRIPYYPFIIGKSRSLTDYCLESPGISRLHLRIDETETGYAITDLNSTNGTKLGGRRMETNETCELKPGDQIEIAGLQFLFL